jgi:hypothetical protein
MISLSEHKTLQGLVMKKILAIISLITLVSCGGGGGGGGTTTAPTGFQQTYTSSATAGELMTYSVDTSALTYSYTITKSSYGCDVAAAACHSGSGTLTKNSDGTYTPSGSPSSKIYALQNGLLMGVVVLNINGTNVTVPVLGVSNPITTASAIAGNYNSVSLQCNAKTYGIFTGCGTTGGTVQVNANGTYTTCSGADITANGHVCANTTSGTLTSLGGGIWQFQAISPAVGATTNYLLAFTAPNGQNVAVVDMNDNLVYGWGQAILSTETATSSAGMVGTYAYINDYGQSGTVTINADGTTSSGLTIAQNSPWNGIATVTGGGLGTGYGMVAGNGVYVYKNSNIPGKVAYMEIGLKIN